MVTPLLETASLEGASLDAVRRVFVRVDGGGRGPFFFVRRALKREDVSTHERRAGAAHAEEAEPQDASGLLHVFALPFGKFRRFSPTPTDAASEAAFLGQGIGRAC